MSDADRHAGDGPDARLTELLSALRTGIDTGAPALWAALTPRARAPLGDEAGARRALANALLAPLVAHVRAEVAPWDARGDVARTTLAVAGPAGDARYLVAARRGADGWRLTGLRRDDLPLT